MLAKVFSQAVYGIDSFLVDVEVHISKGENNFNIVGLPDAAVKESRDRVRAALINSHYGCPHTHITVNLAPADMRKEGPSLDLPIAIGLMAAEGESKRASACSATAPWVNCHSTARSNRSRACCRSRLAPAPGASRE